MTETTLNIIFAGTPSFAAKALEALLKTPHQVIAVYTQPDRPAGRGQKLVESPVKLLAKTHALPLFQPLSLKDPAEQATLDALQADLMVVAAYGLLLPEAVLKAPRLGCINIHASLLPRFRGAAPIQRAILEGESETGITLMQMDRGLDTGPMLLQARCPIELTDTSETLYERLSILGAETLVRALAPLMQGLLSADAQDATQASHAAKLRKEEARLDFRKTAVELDRQVRAFIPWPIAETLFHGQTLRIHQASVGPDYGKRRPLGSILQASAQGLDLQCAEGCLRILKIQAPGGRVLAIGDFLNARQKEFSLGEGFE